MIWSVYIQGAAVGNNVQLDFTPNGLQDGEAMPALVAGDRINFSPAPQGGPGGGIISVADDSAIIEVRDRGQWKITPATAADLHIAAATGMPTMSWVIRSAA
jgi:hypothetical protein